MPSHIPSRSGFVQESEGNFNPEACCAAVRLAVDRLKMFDEDAAVANQVLRPLKKKDAKSNKDSKDDGELAS